MTWYKLYRDLCTKLDIVFPLKQSELSVRINKIPEDVLVFHKRNASEPEVIKELDSLAKAYFLFYMENGESKFYEIQSNTPECSMRSEEYPDRAVTILTIASVMYLSGYKGEKLYARVKDFFNRPTESQNQSN